MQSVKDINLYHIFLDTVRSDRLQPTTSTISKKTLIDLTRSISIAHCANNQPQEHKMASSRLFRLRLFISFAFFCSISEQNPGTLRPISQVAQALLYHQLSPLQITPSQSTPRPLLDRISRQPPSNNITSTYYYLNNNNNNNHHQAQQQNFNRQQQQQQQQQTSYLTGGSEEITEDSYGCPYECHCNKVAQIADCSNRNLTRVPNGFPKDIKRIRLERNNISEIGPYAFQGLRRLQRIDLSNNNLQKLDPLAFLGGLQSLNSLILYSNKLELLPDNLFSELSQLQLLLLNANSIQSISKELFHPLANLNLLSLYDNNLVTLQNGTFDGLKNIKTIHLGKNPLNCDCNLRWLADYFKLNPVETSEARCESPQRIQAKKLSFLHKNDFQCTEQPAPSRVQAPATANNGASQQQQQQDPSCPAGCVCNGSTVDCSGASDSRSGGGIYELPDIPDDLPVYVARVHINDSRIKRIRQTGLFRRLANSQKLDLGNNKIIDIEDNAINGQFTGQNKPERVVFVLIENQHCEPAASGKSTPSSQQQQQATTRQPVAELSPCDAAPKVNEPQFDSPCYNGGSCRPTAATGSGAGNFGSSLTQFGANYTCLCPPGFMGSLCEINIDDCLDHQCQNGALCVDGVNSYKCVCRDPTTTGEFCEQLNPPSGSPPNGGNSILFSYATNSANSINTPLALPIIAPSASTPPQPAPAETHLHNIQSQQQQMNSNQPIMIRSASELYPSRVESIQSNQVTPLAATTTPTNLQQFPPAPSESSCKRVTQRKYVDDGNGCQSVRMLKVSLCLGQCDSGSNLLPFNQQQHHRNHAGDSANRRPPTATTCCAPARVKRRRIRMQCNDGASYVKTIDLIKKCACSSECSPSVGPPPLPPQPQPPSPPFDPSTKSSQSIHRYKQVFGAVAPQNPVNDIVNQQQQHHHQLANQYNASPEDQMLQITRLDAVD